MFFRKEKMSDVKSMKEQLEACLSKCEKFEEKWSVSKAKNVLVQSNIGVSSSSSSTTPKPVAGTKRKAAEPEPNCALGPALDPVLGSLSLFRGFNKINPFDKSLQGDELGGYRDLLGKYIEERLLAIVPGLPKEKMDKLKDEVCGFIVNEGAVMRTKRLNYARLKPEFVENLKRVHELNLGEAAYQKVVSLFMKHSLDRAFAPIIKKKGDNKPPAPEPFDIGREAYYRELYAAIPEMKPAKKAKKN